MRVCAQGLLRLEELVRKVMDIMDNRVAANLGLIQSMLLVDLPADRCAHVGAASPCGMRGRAPCHTHAATTRVTATR
jgi:hypothetical protein